MPDKVPTNQYKQWLVLFCLILAVLFPTPARAANQLKKHRKKRIVVIDPGHGGKDSGAVGRKKRHYEKIAALRVARKLFSLLKKKKGIIPYLTRSGDYFLSLGRRVALANRLRADLFISIHANASQDRKVKGASVYFLSEKGASSKAGRLLARRENRADLIGGIPISKDNWELNAILLTLSQTAVINDSISFGYKVINRFKRSNLGVKIDPTLHSAPFAVLKSPATPAILLEIAFISNPREEKLLFSDNFQYKVAKVLAGGIEDYFTSISPPSVKKTRRKRKHPEKKSYARYLVKKGDTLWKIAKKYNTTPKLLKKINRLKSGRRLQAGRKIKVPDKK